MHLPAGTTHELDGAGQHFLGGSPCEREQEDALGGDARLNQVRHPVDEGTRLPRTGAGDNKERAVTKSGRRELLRIQLLGEIPRDGRLNVGRAVIDLRVGHGVNNRTATAFSPDQGQLRFRGHVIVTRGTVLVLVRDGLASVFVVTVGQGGLRDLTGSFRVEKQSSS